jgi:hypothetical protein
VPHWMAGAPDGKAGVGKDQQLLLQKHHVYSIWRMTKSTGASFDNDAKSCFDRIVMPLVSLISQNMGMPKRACELFLMTLRNMKYFIKTSAGVLDCLYSTTDKRTIHGPGQGGRRSPTIWMIISSLFMKIMKQKSDGCIIQHPFNDTHTTQWIMGFVDDITHLYAAPNKQEPIETIISKMEQAAQW